MSELEYSQNLCFNNKSLDEIFINLKEQYDLNNMSNLNEEEILLVNDVSSSLEKIFSKNNISFDKNNFIKLIKRLYPGSSMYGGNDNDDEIIDYDYTQNNNSKNKIVSIYDLVAILSFILSIYLLYLSFIQFNKLSCDITGNNLLQLSSDIKNQLQQAITSVSNKEITFLKYIYNIFTTFSSNIVSSQQEQISNIIRNILSTSIPDFTSQIQTVCVTSETGWTGFFEATAKSITSGDATTNCITSMSQTLISGFLHKQQEQISIL